MINLFNLMICLLFFFVEIGLYMYDNGLNKRVWMGWGIMISE